MEKNFNTLEIHSKKVIEELSKNLETEEPFEETSILYILKNKDVCEDVYEISSDYLKEGMPQTCQVVESRKVAVECFYNGRWGHWMFSPILKKASENSGFSAVEKWLDRWSKTKKDFEYNKRYYLWLLKLKYPIKKQKKPTVAQ